MHSCAIHVHKHSVEAMLLQQCREVTTVIHSITPWLPTYMGQSLIRCNRGGGGGGCGGGGGGSSADGDSGRWRWEADLAVLAVFLNNFRKSFNSCADISFPDFINLRTSSPRFNASLSKVASILPNLFRSFTAISCATFVACA